MATGRFTRAVFQPAADSQLGEHFIEVGYEAGDDMIGDRQMANAVATKRAGWDDLRE